MPESKLQLADWLDDLCVRFIVNLPREELESVERICFQVEEAQWFYEDFIRPLDPSLPSLNLKQFCLRIFQHCPLFSGYDAEAHSLAFSEFLAYKTRVPVRGAIMLNEAMDAVVLVKGWRKNANWSFPRGKINKDEKDLDCAIREVYEETGYDLRAAGLVENEADAKYIEVTMREQHMRLYVFSDVPMDTHFEPRTRKEISKIQWYKLSELPTLKKLKQQQQQGHEETVQHANKFYMVAPFLDRLKKIISLKKKIRQSNSMITSAPRTPGIMDQQDLHDQQSTNYNAPSLAMNDMTRLMAQLRQSRPHGVDDDLPELSDSNEMPPAIPYMSKPHSHSQHTSYPSVNGSEYSIDPRQASANAMLALLQSSTQAHRQSHLSMQPPPETPFEQVSHMPPPMPRSPSPKHPRTVSSNNFPPPPSFPFSPGQIGSSAFHGSQSSYQAPANTRYNQPIYQQQNPSGIRPQQIQPQALQYGSQSTQPAAPAPYQRTGDPQFAQAREDPVESSSGVPKANELPIPRLNAHSSSLLSLFKEMPSKAQQIPIISEAPAYPVAQASRQRVPSQQYEPPQQSPQEVHHDSAPWPVQSTKPKVEPTSEGNIPFTVNQPLISNQQTTLLDLFKSPKSDAATPARSTGSLQPSQLAPVELAAHRTPAHSRVTSRLDPYAEQAALAYRRPNAISIPTSTVSTAMASPPPPSATVTGPLNIPQFEKILKRPVEVEGKVPVRLLKSPALHQPKATAAEPSKPVKILSRPNTSGKGLETAEAKRASPASSASSVRAARPVRESLRAQKSSTTKAKTSAPKPFAPQILKRPEQAPQPALEMPKPLQPPPTIYSYNNNSDKTEPKVERRISQSTTPATTKQDQRQTLLALFNKTGFEVSPPTPTRGSVAVSPVSEKPGHESIITSPLMSASASSQRSRIGSLHSLADGRMGSEKPTPKASPIDKQFLLGFLDGVLKEKRM